MGTVKIADWEIEDCGLCPPKPGEGGLSAGPRGSIADFSPGQSCGRPSQMEFVLFEISNITN
jgi:hypothetical protein